MTSDGNIEPFLHQIYKAISRMHQHMDLGMGQSECGQMVGEVELRRWHRSGQPNRSARLGKPPADNTLRCFGLDQRGTCMIEKIAPGISERKTTRCPMNEPSSETFLERRHALADRRFGISEVPRRRRESTLLDYLHEEIEVVEI